ncbi:septation protein SepH [Brachybacterium subflavum]|uniref:septation protein SepH n=1 Tax=Brachybacterium subflavum TaxID=2585206 RepID=UPI0012665934|nr:septation protein SepH [Brachybacterium subflavum]
MRELELDGIHDDGEHIVLRDLDGEQYTLRIDEALRAAVRRDRPALGLIQSSEATALRPREIQALLRGGRTADEISEMASIDVEHVRRYEGPVLAERGFTAERARTFKVDRSGGPVLDDIVTERLAARQALEGLRWDAWRLPDGTWNLELVFRSGGRDREAHWIADMTRQVVVAEDDEARWLSLDDDALDQPVAGRARLTSLKSSVYDQESDADGASARPRRSAPRSLGRQAPAHEDHPSRGATGAGASSGPSARGGRGDAIDEDALDALNARRGLRSVPASLDDEPTWSTLEEDEERSTRSADEDALREYSNSPREDLPEDVDEDDVDGGAPADDEDLEVTGGPEGDADAEPEPLVVPGRTLEESVATGDRGAEDEPPAASGSVGKDLGSGFAPAANDTVDLTPLPGFDDVAHSPEEDGDAQAPKDGDGRQGEVTGQRSGGKEAKRSGKGEKKSSSSRAKRSSIPSWDEIVFGSKHD